ncbi:acyl carrier protein [Streptomyces zaehneri]|uniref:acyl carrier protein n=1 Tax=Streptomyces zaehneri TaxID=3051180 RepID=UPI0028D052F7|nr:acyl carrier protein [Streptomyces sp. DSM 40713]
MTHDVFEIIDGLFRNRLQVPELNPDVPLVDYGLDSVRSIDLVVEMENRFGVPISDEQAASMLTLRDVVDQVTASLTVRAGQGESAA